MMVRDTTTVDRGVIQTGFEIEVSGDVVPCVAWTPESVKPRVLIAMGHGGSQHKKTESIRQRAVHYASKYGWASLAIDAPGHGDRITREQAEIEIANAKARLEGDTETYVPMSPHDKISYLDSLAAKAVPEWRKALDAVQELEMVTDDHTIGYWGISMGTWIGVPLLAAETRFQCAVLGLSHLHPDHVTFRRAAGQITIPVRFAFQWDDEVRQTDYGIDLYNAFGSRDKSMHVNPGGHLDIPGAESDSWEVFFQRHLDSPSI